MEGLTYLAMILGWASPVILLHWAVGWRVLMGRRRHLLVAWIMSTGYLGLADVAAIHDGIWSINPQKTIAALSFGSFVFEEWLFFALTNLIIIQTVILILDEDLRTKAVRLIRRR